MGLWVGGGGGERYCVKEGNDKAAHCVRSKQMAGRGSQDRDEGLTLFQRNRPGGQVEVAACGKGAAWVSGKKRHVTT